MERKPPWYRRYQEYRSKVERLKTVFEDRCTELGTDPEKELRQFQNDIIARIVHESNWQEGIYLDEHRTQELAALAIDERRIIQGPHLDMDAIVANHYSAVSRLREEGASAEEMAAYNLSTAHVALWWVYLELQDRQIASLANAMEKLKDDLDKIRERVPLEKAESIKEKFNKAQKAIQLIVNDDTPVGYPLTESLSTKRELFRLLMEMDLDELVHPMRCDYVHFLHRLALMGMLPHENLGIFRNTGICVGNDVDLYFPTPGVVPELLDRFCREFPSMVAGAPFDRVYAAAKTSYEFVRIHPYTDGNGRVSRLLMNLVLLPDYPPIYLKADREGRHRYIQALKRANNGGNLDPLASLISISLIISYQRLLEALRVPREDIEALLQSDSTQDIPEKD